MMTIKVLHAGDGYRYLTGQVASADVVREKGQGLVDYYAESGNPPGRWLGNGRFALDVDGVVDENHMAALYGECRHAKADAIEKGLIALGMSAEDARKETQLGRALQTFKNEPDDYDKFIAKEFAVFEAHHGRMPARGDEATRVKFEATRGYIMTSDGNRDVADREVKLFLAERGSKDRQPVSGYDLVFTPSKSVSVLWGVGDDETRRTIERIHDEAVTSSIAFLEQHVAVGRQGAHSVAQVNLEGLTVAAFDHSNSRTGDPNLHTHAVVANRGRTADGKWLALDGRVLHQYAVAGSEHYNNAVMAGLNRELGLTTYQRHVRRNAQPVWEIAGVPQELCEEFSQRRPQVVKELEELIEAYKDFHGHEPSVATQRRLAQVATLESRPDKDMSLTPAQEREVWRKRAATVMGVEGESFTLQRSVLPRVGAVDVVLDDSIRDVISQNVIENLESKRTRWTYAHVHAESMREVQAFFAPTEAAAEKREEIRPGFGAVTIDSIRDRQGEAEVIAAGAHGRHSINLNAPELDAKPAALRRLDGESQLRSHHEEWHTSERMYSMEQRLLEAGTLTSGPVIDPENASLMGRLGKHPLMPSQEAAARRFLGSGLELDAVIGAAGTGKTTTMKAFVEGANIGGAKVVALSPTLAAAAVLGDEIGAPAESVQMFIAVHTKGAGNAGPMAVGPDTFILIDEAGMASTPHLDKVLSIAREHGASVRLIGDPEQLDSPGAGGFLRYFHKKLDAAELTEVLRFTSVDEKEATIALRNGDLDVIDYYVERDRLHSGSRSEMLDAIYADWRADIDAGRDSLMMARSNDDVHMLSDRAQADRVAAGEVVMTDIVLDGGSRVGLGDQIVTRQVDRDLRDSANAVVTNGATWTVTGADVDGALTARRDATGAEVTLPAEYVREHVDLAYASTFQRTQGRTVDVTRPLVDDSMSRQELYVPMSRGRDENHAYVVNHRTVDIDADHPAGMPASPRDIMASVISRDGAQITASETLEAEYERTNSLRTWLVEYEYAQREFAPDVDHKRVRDVLQSAFGDASAYVQGDNEAWPRVARAIAEHDRADGNVVAKLRERVDVNALAADVSPGRLVLERLGDVGPGRRTADPELNAYLEAVEVRIKERLGQAVLSEDLPMGRDVNSLRAAWGVQNVAERPREASAAQLEALERAQQRNERLRAIEGRRPRPVGDVLSGVDRALEELGPEDPKRPGRQL